MFGRRGRRRSVAPVHVNSHFGEVGNNCGEANVHFGEVGTRGQLARGDANSRFGEVGSRGQLTHGDVNFGEVGNILGEVTPVHRSADLIEGKIGGRCQENFIEGKDGGRCQENGRLEVKEEWGTDIKPMGDQNGPKERKKRKKRGEEGETSAGANFLGEKSSGGNDLLETLQLLGQEVNAVVFLIVGFVVVILVVGVFVIFVVIVFEIVCLRHCSCLTKM